MYKETSFFYILDWYEQLVELWGKTRNLDSNTHTYWLKWRRAGYTPPTPFLEIDEYPTTPEEDETHTIPSQESEENQSDTQYETTPNSPLWETDQIDLPENWPHNGTDEEKFDTINQYKQWVKEDQVAWSWERDNADWYNEEYHEAS